VAARGLDLPALSHVVNYDFPPSLPMYAHRVGRAARGEGQTGTALSFFTRNLSRMAPDLVRLLEGAGQAVDHHLRRLANDVAAEQADGGGATEQADGGGDAVIAEDDASPLDAEELSVRVDDDGDDGDDSVPVEAADDDDGVNTDAQVFGVAPLVPFASLPRSTQAAASAPKRKRPRGKRGGAASSGGKRAKRL